MTENDLRYNQDIYKIFAVYFSILLPSIHINNIITLMNYNTNESWFTVFSPSPPSSPSPLLCSCRGSR